MIDGRILAAVLASLAAVGAALGGGDISTDQIKDSTLSAPGSSSFSDVMPDWDIMDRFFETPEPENQMEAVLVAENLENEVLSVTNTRLSSPELTSVDLVMNIVESSEPVSLHGFTGEVDPGNVTTITGSSNMLKTNSVNISGGMQIEEEIDQGRIELKGVERSSIDLENTVVDVTTEGDDYNANTPRRVTINSFSGDLVMFTDNSTMFLDGKVHKIESGDFSFGG